MGISASVRDLRDFTEGLGIQLYAAAMVRQQCLHGSATIVCTIGSADYSSGAQRFALTLTVAAGAQDQDAQGAVAMASAMWQMMNPTSQEQQRQSLVQDRHEYQGNPQPILGYQGHLLCHLDSQHPHRCRNQNLGDQSKLRTLRCRYS